MEFGVKQCNANSWHSQPSVSHYNESISRNCVDVAVWSIFRWFHEAAVYFVHVQCFWKLIWRIIRIKATYVFEVSSRLYPIECVELCTEPSTARYNTNQYWLQVNRNGFEMKRQRQNRKFTNGPKKLTFKFAKCHPSPLCVHTESETERERDTHSTPNQILCVVVALHLHSFNYELAFIISFCRFSVSNGGNGDGWLWFLRNQAPSRTKSANQMDSLFSLDWRCQHWM